MEVRSMLASVGIGMVAGAAAILMVPKHSEAYRVADDAARAIKDKASQVLDNVKKD